MRIRPGDEKGGCDEEDFSNDAVETESGYEDTAEERKDLMVSW